jgi:hypothetical protein
VLGVVLFGFGIGNATSLPPLIAQVEFVKEDVPRVVPMIVALGQGIYAFAPAAFGLIRELAPTVTTASAGAAPYLLPRQPSKAQPSPASCLAADGKSPNWKPVQNRSEPDGTATNIVRGAGAVGPSITNSNLLADDERLFILLVAWLLFGDWRVTASIRCGPVTWQILVVLRDPCVETTQWHVKILNGWPKVQLFATRRSS